MAINTQDIKTLIDLVKDNGVHEISITDKSGYTVTVRQHAQVAATPAVTQITAPAAAPAADTPVAAPSEESGHVVRSPMVGTVYLAASPDKDDFVSIGKSVKAGDTLCLVEAMKMFNKIKADRSGTIKACKVTNGQPIEFDQPLFIIE